jgi:NADPH-dependent 2,4-dienoyl-CoA reductase/sulfur reductase-like enzyme
MFLSEHEKNGVKMHMGRTIQTINGDGKTATSVTLDNGTELEADVILLATGVRPATKFL